MRAYQPFVSRTVATCLLVLLAVSSLALLAWPAHAATERIYVPETGHYVGGVFRDFWDKNGALPNFGFPISEEYIDPASKRVFQYFERARFERDTLAGTSITLANLGVVAVGDKKFPQQQPITNTSQRRYFPETKQIVQYGFKTIWETRGAQAIFGLPLSSELDEKMADGETRTVQYFEKVRFEYHPELPDGQRVIVSALGRQYAPPAVTAPLPPPGAPQPTAAPPAGTPAPQPTAAPPPPTAVPPTATPGPQGPQASVAPATGLVGQPFTLKVTGMRAKEIVSFWLTAPGGQVFAFDETVESDKNGQIEQFRFTIEAGEPLGTWAVTAQGVRSDRKAVTYFTVLGQPVGKLPQPTPQPGMPANVNASAAPKDGPVGTLFFFDARGFRAGEEVKLGIVGSDGRQIEFPTTIKADANGGIGYAKPYYLARSGDSLGLYSFVSVGTSSGATSTAYFVLTP